MDDGTVEGENNQCLRTSAWSAFSTTPLRQFRLIRRPWRSSGKRAILRARPRKSPGSSRPIRLLLPEFLSEAIRGHHRTPSGREPDETASLVAVCVLANRLARSHGTGVGSNETDDPDLPSVILEILGISDNDVVELSNDVKKQIEDGD